MVLLYELILYLISARLSIITVFILCRYVPHACVDILSWVLGNSACNLRVTHKVRHDYVYIVLLLFMTVIMILIL